MSAKTSNPVFNNAANVEVQQLNGLSNEQLLELYGSFSQGDSWGLVDHWVLVLKSIHDTRLLQDR